MSLHKTDTLFRTCLNSCCLFSTTSNHSPPVCNITVGLWAQNYDPVVHALPFNKVIKHQDWLTSHRKLLNELSATWQQCETLADGHADLGTLMRLNPTPLPVLLPSPFLWNTHWAFVQRLNLRSTWITPFEINCSYLFQSLGSESSLPAIPFVVFIQK